VKYAAGVNLYEFVNGMPTGHVDPLGLLPAWLCGIIAHGIIESKVADSNANAFSYTFLNRSVSTISKAVGTRTSKSIRRPDIVLVNLFPSAGDLSIARSTGVVYEIKPDSLYGHTTGPTQVLDYTLLLHAVGVHVRPGCRLPGSSGPQSAKSINVPGCGDLTWSNSEPGMIYYRWNQSSGQQQQENKPINPTNMLEIFLVLGLMSGSTATGTATTTGTVISTGGASVATATATTAEVAAGTGYLEGAASILSLLYIDVISWLDPYSYPPGTTF